MTSRPITIPMTRRPHSQRDVVFSHSEGTAASPTPFHKVCAIPQTLWKGVGEAAGPSLALHRIADHSWAAGPFSAMVSADHFFLQFVLVRRLLFV